VTTDGTLNISGVTGGGTTPGDTRTKKNCWRIYKE